MPGIRTGRYSKKRSLLLVTAGVPNELPMEPHTVDETMSIMILQSVEAAADFARTRKIAADLPELRALAQSIVDEFAVNR
ncbi:hypothetical protein SAMN05892883_0509 [Jatrophihabitans sp. GAS493]|nr:hypothetical protein SAMN05892883_0509 [Jatrophihabitans sp. GAS493]